MPKNSYQHIEDFLQDPTFTEWVNRSDPDSYIHWEQWLNAHPAKREMAEQAKLIVRGIDFRPRYISEEKVKEKWQQFNDARRQSEKQQKIRSLKPRWFIRGVAAAVTLLLLAVGFHQYYQSQEQVYRTAFGERLEIQLPDGTEVTLNSNSNLRFVRNNPRNIKLEGEAFFTVSKKPRTGEKFVVRTNDLNVEVLGTVFNVNSRNEQTEVVLEEGKVKLDLKEGSSLLMEPGTLELVTYSATKKEIIQQEVKVKPELHTSWKDGMLEFDHTPLSEALQILEDTYGVEVIFQDTSTSSRVLDGGVPNDNLEVFIRTLKTIYGLDIEQQDQQLIIK